MAPRPTGAQLRAVGIVAGAVAVLWVAGLVWLRPWIAHNDFAIFRLALERELDGHVRLVGAHSRLDVFHPGPLREWVFALPYWISGRRAAALPATSLALNALWSVWILVLARRLRAGAWAAACAAGLLVLVVALGPDLASPWNPHLAILPMYLACWAAVSVVASGGDGWAACIVGASFAAQLHASALVLGGLLLVTALVALAVQRRWTRVASAVGLGFVLWSGPIVDLRKGADANLVRLVTVGADGESIGLGDAAGHVSRLVWPGTPLGRVTVRPSVEVLSGFPRWWLLLIVVVLSGATWRSFRRGSIASHRTPDRPDVADGSLDAAEADGTVDRQSAGPDALPVAAGALAICTLLVAVVSVSLFVEPAYRYLYGPLQAGAVFAVSVVTGFALAAIEVAAEWRVPDWFVGIAIPVALVAVLVSVPRLDAASDERAELDVEGAVGAALAARPNWRTVEAIPLGLVGAGDLDAEVLDVALRNGADARSRRTQLGLPAPGRVDGVFGVAMGPALDCLLASPGSEEIVRGTAASGETFAIVAVDGDSVAYDACIGAPGG